MTDYNSDPITVKGHMWNEVLLDTPSFILQVCIQHSSHPIPKSKYKYIVQDWLQWHWRVTLVLNSVFNRLLHWSKKNKNGFGCFLGDSQQRAKFSLLWMSKVWIFIVVSSWLRPSFFAGIWEKLHVRNSNEGICEVGASSVCCGRTTLLKLLCVWLYYIDFT